MYIKKILNTAIYLPYSKIVYHGTDFGLEPIDINHAINFIKLNVLYTLQYTIVIIQVF